MNPVEQLIYDLTAINSINPDLVAGGVGEAEIARFIAGWLEQAGLEVHVQEVKPGRPNVIGVARGSGGGKSLMLNGHIDTVGTAGMPAAEARPSLREGRLYGRGTYDMKGGLAACMLAAAEAKKLNLRGVIELSEALTLGEGGDIEYEGCGVIIAPGITLQGGLKRKAGTDSVCVLLTRGQAIQVNTESRIEAALVSLGRNDRNGQVIAGKKLDLLGCLAADNLNLARWAEGVDHKIVYDPAFKRNNDLYQVNIARWVTFERMVEQDE